MPPETPPPDPFKPPAHSTPPVVFNSGSGPSLLAKFGQFLRNPMGWIVTGVVGVAILGGGVTLYLVSNHKQPTAQAPVDTVVNNDKQPVVGAELQTTPTTPEPNTQQNTQPNNPASKPAGNTNTGGSSGGGGGGSTPHGPLALKIMALGDSLTQGGVNDPQTVNGYRLQLWNNLGSNYQIDYVGTWQNGNSSLADKDLNGFSGACIKHSPCGGGTLYPQTAGWITSENPDLVIMQGGGNDFSDPTMTEATVQTYMEDWINLVWATKPSVKIIVSGPAQWYPTYAATLETYVNQLKAAGKPIRYVQYDDVDTVDGTHASLTGYVVWGDRLADKVRELFPN